jgi:hypothetical protein
MIVFKLLKGIYDSNIACHLVKPNNLVMRGHHLRLFRRHVHYDLRKYFFEIHIISNWNSLPDYVITANTVGIFEKRLDQFWRNQACFFDDTADVDVAGVGSRSQT